MIKALSTNIFALMLAFQVHAFEVIVDERQVIDFNQPMPSFLVDSDTLINPDQNRLFSLENYPQSIQPSAKGSWYKIRLKASFTNQQPQRRTIVIDSHIIRHLHFYLFDNNDLIKNEQLGIKDPNNIIQHTDLSNYQSPYFQFYIQNEKPLTLLIYKQNNGPSILPMTIYTDEGLKQKERKINFFWGGIICVLLVMAMYNVIVYAMHPNKAYLWYMAFHSLMIIYFGGLNGYGYLIFPLEFQIFLSQNIMALNFFIIFIVMNFSSIFLDIKSNAPRFFKFIKPISIASIAGGFTSFFLPDYTMIPIFTILQLFGSVFGIAAAITAYRNHYKPAKYFLMSWIFTLLGGAIGMGTVLGSIPINFFTLHGFMFGTLAELFLFSVALAHRMKSIEMDMLSHSYIYPDTNIGNFTYLKSLLPQLIPTIQEKNERIIVIIAEIYGLKDLVRLYGPQALSDFYRNQTGLISEHIKKQSWSIPMDLPSGEKIHLIALPGEQIFLMGNIPINLTNDEEYEFIKNLIESLGQKIDESSSNYYHNIKIRFTAGCSLLKSSEEFSDCHRQSQVALLTAQKTNKIWERYTPKQDELIINQVALMGELERAINNDDLNIYIQPQFSLDSLKLNGGEILLRWNHPEKGFIGPHIFIPLAEQSGLVFSITKFVINKTCEWLSEIKDEHPKFYETFEVSINLSALDMAQDQLISHLQSSIFYHGIDSSKLVLEVTESAVLANADLFLNTIQKLKLLGFRISIDDFGTGYSSMQYLQTMKADEIKIDMAFIRGIDKNITSQNIAKAIIQLAHSTGARTVAEGIQSDEEMQCLKSLNCSKAQGFYWTPAIPLNQFTQEHIAIR